MTKKIKKTVLVVGIVMLIGVIAIACTQSPFGRYERNISEIRDNIFIAYDADMRVEVISGHREEPFNIDGVRRGELVPFTVVTITPSENIRRDAWSYSVSMNDTEFVGNFLPHPFLDTFSCDIAAATVDRAISVTITAEGFERTFEMTSIVTDGMIRAEDAFNIALERLESSLSGHYQGNRLNAEVYIRLVTNPITSTDIFFWYVAFVTPCDTTMAVLIDPMTSEILAARE